mmetsp:Transcript_20089/g.23144  ORF Transcript_20089/g.23144 Transcript_20089/m.23144 type:complete len:162 (+) Transcript_20089:26-511(+)
MKNVVLLIAFAAILSVVSGVYIVPTPFGETPCGQLKSTDVIDLFQKVHSYDKAKAEEWLKIIYNEIKTSNITMNFEDAAFDGTNVESGLTGDLTLKMYKDEEVEYVYLHYKNGTHKAYSRSPLNDFERTESERNVIDFMTWLWQVSCAEPILEKEIPKTNL